MICVSVYLHAVYSDDSHEPSELRFVTSKYIVEKQGTLRLHPDCKTRQEPKLKSKEANDRSNKSQLHVK
jgi:hypothetical protein